MRVTAIREKTVTIEMDAGERYDVDDNGFSVSEITLKWSGNETLKNRLTGAIKRVKALDDSSSDWEKKDSHDDRNILLSVALQTLPVYKSKRVWVGNSF